jgi:hypothetical protein
MTEKKKPEIVFAPGCFDSFEGTQEELDELVAEIHQLFESGEAFEKAKEVELDDIDDEVLEAIARKLGEGDERKTH